MKKVMKTIVSVATTAVRTLFVTRERRARDPTANLPTPPPFIGSFTRLLDDVVLRLEEAEPAAARA